MIRTEFHSIFSFAFQKVSLEWRGILKISVTPDPCSSVGSSSSVGLALIFPLDDVQTPVTSGPLEFPLEAHREAAGMHRMFSPSCCGLSHS